LRITARLNGTTADSVSISVQGSVVSPGTFRPLTERDSVPYELISEPDSFRELRVPKGAHLGADFPRSAN
jgi:hypothetical protein